MEAAGKELTRRALEGDGNLPWESFATFDGAPALPS